MSAHTAGSQSGSGTAVVRLAGGVTTRSSVVFTTCGVPPHEVKHSARHSSGAALRNIRVIDDYLADFRDDLAFSLRQQVALGFDAGEQLVAAGDLIKRGGSLHALGFDLAGQPGLRGAGLAEGFRLSCREPGSGEQRGDQGRHGAELHGGEAEHYSSARRTPSLMTSSE